MHQIFELATEKRRCDKKPEDSPGRLKWLWCTGTGRYISQHAAAEDGTAATPQSPAPYSYLCRHHHHRFLPFTSGERECACSTRLVARHRFERASSGTRRGGKKKKKNAAVGGEPF